MDATLGDEAAFATGTQDEVLAHAKAQIQGEAQAEAKAERAEKLAAQEEARTEHEKLTGMDRVLREDVDRRADREGAVIGWGLALLLGAAVTLGILATIPGFPLLDVEGLVWRIIIWVCIGAAVAVGLFAVLVKDVPVLHVQRWIAGQVAEARRQRGYRKLDDMHARAARSG